jgi:prepilin-type processing-associated H-X9-DG protein
LSGIEFHQVPVQEMPPMPIDFTCPHCQARTVVADEFAGQTGPCANCGQTITVPSAGMGMAPPPVSSGGGKSVATIVLIIVGAAVLGLLGCGGVMFALLTPAVTQARGAAQRTQCMNNLKVIGLAMHNYHEVNGTLPPAYQADANGKPMHSWRVLLTPYMEAANVYQMYDMNQPWDSQANDRVKSMMPAVLHCPSDPAQSPYTNYVVVTGPETLFDGDKGTKFSDITDGMSNTIMVVEAAGMDVPWTEPRDLDFSQMSMAVGSQPGNCVHSHHAGGANVLMADGSVRFVSSGMDPQMLRASLTKAGGEVVSAF